MLMSPLGLGAPAASDVPPLVEGMATGRGVPGLKRYTPLGPWLVTPVPLSHSRRNSPPKVKEWRPVVHWRLSRGSKTVVTYFVSNESGPQFAKLPSEKVVSVVVNSAGVSGTPSMPRFSVKVKLFTRVGAKTCVSLTE